MMMSEIGVNYTCCKIIHQVNPSSLMQIGNCKVDCCVIRQLSHDRTTLLPTVEIQALRICSFWITFMFKCMTFYLLCRWCCFDARGIGNSRKWIEFVISAFRRTLITRMKKREHMFFGKRADRRKYIFKEDTSNLSSWL